MIIRSPEVSKNVLKHFNEEFSEENAWRITRDFNPDEKAGKKKRMESASRRVFPKAIL